MRALLPLLLVAACGEGTLCPEGTEPGEDGACVPVEDDTDAPDDDTDTPDDPDAETDLGDLLVRDQPCEPLPAGDRLALIDGCADGICAKVTLAEAARAAGRPPTCGPGPSAGWLACDWPSGVTANVYDQDSDGQAAPGEVVWWVSVEAPFGGADPDGLGLGISPGCFVEAFGEPDQVTITRGDDDRLMLGYGFWEAFGVVIRDLEGGPQPYRPDGRVDTLALYGPPGD